MPLWYGGKLCINVRRHGRDYFSGQLPEHLLKQKLRQKLRLHGPTKKKANFLLRPPHGYQSWPMLLPYDMLTGLVTAGCADRLWLDSNIFVGLGNPILVLLDVWM